MSQHTSHDDMPILEAMIDHHGLYCVMAMLSEIAAGKSEHLAHNWQDANGAKRWITAMEIIDKASAKVDDLDLH